MPNDVSDAIHNAEHAVEGFLKNTVEPALEAEWQAIKPQVIALGETVLSQVWQAALLYVTSGGNAAAAIASVTVQLPSDLAASEHIVAAAWAGAVQSIQAKQAAPAAP